MALTITLLGEGATFKVGDLEVCVTTVHSSSDFVVRANDQLFAVNEDSWVTIAKGIQLRAPFPQEGHLHRVRVQIEAPDFFVTRTRRA